MTHPDGPVPTPEQQLMRLCMGKIVSRCLTLVADLGVADHIGDTPVSTAELARQTGSHPDALYRVMRALAAVGVFAEHRERRFGHTPTSLPLRDKAEGSLRSLVRWLNSDCSWQAWGAIDHSIKSGEPSFDHKHGRSVFSYFQDHPEVARVFDQAMGNITRGIGAAVARAYDFTGIEHLVDIGGSQGVLLSAILSRFPNLRGTLFELPQVLEHARPVVAAGPHAARITLAAGDFHDGVPAGADAYIMKSIVHDWSDDHCITLLGNCRRAMRPGGRVLVVEGVVDDTPASVPRKMLDLEMLVMTPGGRERTEAEYGQLFGKAGLKLARVTPTDSGSSVLEARAA
jgi:hypothetical protein